MIRYALIAALVACLGLLGALWWQTEALTAAEAEAASLARSVAAQQAAIAQRDEAARVAAARAARWEARAGELGATVETILTANLGECADAPLDPALSDLLRGLRPAR